jgi:HJR/Mrr/RecB family endonuclease
MKFFLTRLAILAVILVGAVVFVNSIPKSAKKPKESPKTFYDVVREDDVRLRADPTPVPKPAPAPKQQTATPKSESAESAEQPQAEKPAPRQFKELSEIDRIQAERLFEMAITHRKVGRLPGPTYKQMIDYCREIISKYPGTVYEYKAKRMLADIPERYRRRYNITQDEINYEN